MHTPISARFKHPRSGIPYCYYMLSDDFEGLMLQVDLRDGRKRLYKKICSKWVRMKTSDLILGIFEQAFSGNYPPEINN